MSGPPRQYQWYESFAGGAADLRLVVPAEFAQEDLDDLLAWWDIVRRQLSRLKPLLDNAKSAEP